MSKEGNHYSQATTTWNWDFIFFPFWGRGVVKVKKFRSEKSLQSVFKWLNWTQRKSTKVVLFIVSGHIPPLAIPGYCNPSSILNWSFFFHYNTLIVIIIWISSWNQITLWTYILFESFPADATFFFFFFFSIYRNYNLEKWKIWWKIFLGFHLKSWKFELKQNGRNIWKTKNKSPKIHFFPEVNRRKRKWIQTDRLE